MKTLYTNVRVIDCTGDDPFAGEVLIENRRIAEVVRAPQRIPCDDCDVIDGNGATLCPA